MADRYLVATGNYGDVNTWSATDGGAAGASVPTSSDNVHFTANSNGLTLTVNVTGNSYDFVADVANTATIDGSSLLRIYGDMTLHANMTFSKTGIINWYATDDGKVLTSAGLTFACILNIQGGTKSFGDAITLSGSSYFNLLTGTLDTNDQTVTNADYWNGGAGGVSTLILGASVINCKGWSMGTGVNLTITAGTSSIRVTGAGIFDGGGKTYYEVQLNGTAHTISGSNTFNKLVLNPAGVQTITWTDTSTQSIGSMRRSGTGLITFAGSGTAEWAITKIGSGVIKLYNVSISYSTVTPRERIWFASGNSVDGGNNIGWIFGKGEGSGLISILKAMRAL